MSSAPGDPGAEPRELDPGPEPERKAPELSWMFPEQAAPPAVRARARELAVALAAPPPPPRSRRGLLALFLVVPVGLGVVAGVAFSSRPPSVEAPRQPASHAEAVSHAPAVAVVVSAVEVAPPWESPTEPPAEEPVAIGALAPPAAPVPIVRMPAPTAPDVVAPPAKEPAAPVVSAVVVVEPPAPLASAAPVRAEPAARAETLRVVGAAVRGWLLARRNLKCHSCKGTARVACPHCKGKGLEPSGEDGEPCSVCSLARDHTVRCEDCAGTGVVASEVTRTERLYGLAAGPLLEAPERSISIELDDAGAASVSVQVRLVDGTRALERSSWEGAGGRWRLVAAPVTIPDVR